MPEEPPEAFVPDDYAAFLAARLHPLKAIAVRYAKLLMGTGQLYPINTAKLEKYRKIGELLTMCDDVLLAGTGVAVIDILRQMDAVNTAIAVGERVDPDYIAEMIYLDIQLMSDGHTSIKYEPLEFIQITKRYRRHYESIRHLI
ncbi:hypothetical protein [Fictibacillus enclensis]|uniref:hypothetical protein n=1 Tax=Fictibacillus enclensis TaxID=1017270 RepID=UPI0024C0410E|nr:hypothetical protein [Fictibacillus enclensis]WHY73451.1 hypothetical protein QNH15_05935 [Fictibacillus enclensis]